MILIKYYRASERPFQPLNTMNFSTTADDFTTLKNGIDSRLEIIRHDETGYYNITKTAKLVHELKSAESEVHGIPCTSNVRGKQINHWFANDSTKELIQKCSTLMGLEFVHYELKTGTPTRFAGTYVHKLIYDHFLAWLDVDYAIKISMILDEIHSKANVRIIQERETILWLSLEIFVKRHALLFL